MEGFCEWKSQKDLPGQLYFRAVPLNAGTHQVEFVYDPMSFKLGAGVTLLGILGCHGYGMDLRDAKRTA